MKPETDALLVAVDPPSAFVRVRGRGSFKFGPALKKFGASAIERRCRRIVMDMSECIGMDSTFMGVMAGLAMRLRKECEGELVMLNLGPKNLSLLSTLGLDQLLRVVDASGAPPPEQMLPEASLSALDAGGTDRRVQAQTMIDAHEDLVRLSPENQSRFKDVLAYLKEDLQRSGGASDEGGE